MNDEVRKIGGVWMPARETHMISFLTDPATTVDGVGTYQLHKIRRVLSEMAKAGYKMRRALDCGAHVGTWTRFLAKNFEWVECYEPHPTHRECWFRNMREWDILNVTMTGTALGAEDGEASLLTNPHSSGDTWLSDGKSHPDYEVVGTIPVRTLDGEEFRDVDLIKVDCEGGELAVLRGALRILATCRPFVCVEQKPGRAEKYDLPRTAACDFLESLGAKRVAEISGDYLYAFPRA